MNHYIAFQKVVETGSFTRAAAELGYTQSSVSQMVAALEENWESGYLFAHIMEFI